MKFPFSWVFWPRLVAVMYMLYMLGAIVLAGKTWFFIDGVNLLFHEAGHFILGIFGIIGGTLMQLLIPLACTIYFWFWRNEGFNTSLCVFWMGENFINISVYIKDAIVGELFLIGGGVHDWTTMLGNWGVLRFAEEIGAGVYWTGVTIMMGAICLAVFWLLQTRPKPEMRYLPY